MVVLIIRYHIQLKLRQVRLIHPIRNGTMGHIEAVDQRRTTQEWKTSIRTMTILKSSTSSVDHLHQCSLSQVLLIKTRSPQLPSQLQRGLTRENFYLKTPSRTISVTLQWVCVIHKCRIWWAHRSIRNTSCLQLAAPCTFQRNNNKLAWESWRSIRWVKLNQQFSTLK